MMEKSKKIRKLLSRMSLHFIAFCLCYFLFSMWFWFPRPGIVMDKPRQVMLTLHILSMFIASVIMALSTYFKEDGLKEKSIKVWRYGFVLAIIVFTIGCLSWLWLPNTYWQGL